MTPREYIRAKRVIGKMIKRRGPIKRYQVTMVLILLYERGLLTAARAVKFFSRSKVRDDQKI